MNTAAAPYSITEWMAQGKELARQGNKNRWGVADWLLTGKRVGADSKYKDAAAILQFSAGACRNYASVALAFPPEERNGDATFTHHAAVASLDRADRMRLLSENLPVSKLRAEVRKLKTGGEVKAAKPPQFILTGCKPGEYLHDQLTRLGGDKPVEVYVLELLTAHVAEAMAATPESRARHVAEQRAALVKRLRRIPQLGSEVIHAATWQERTVERVTRLLYIAKPPAAEGLDGFLSMYEQVWGADKLPLKWVLGLNKEGTKYHLGPVGDHMAGIYKLNASRPVKDGQRVRTPLAELPATYTDAVEAERNLILKAEQAEYEVLHPDKGKPPVVVTTSCAEAFPDDEPGFYVQEHRARLKEAVADNARAAQVAREACAAKLRRAVLDYFTELSKPLSDGSARPPITPRSLEMRFYKVKGMKHAVARLVKEGEVRLLDGVYSIPAPPAPQEAAGPAPTAEIP